MPVRIASDAQTELHRVTTVGADGVESRKPAPTCPSHSPLTLLH